MGEVFKAYDPSLQRFVALKVLPAEVTSSRERLERFIQEARSASALNHPNVVTVYEIGEADSVHYIAMELVEGSTLREEVHSKRSEPNHLLQLLLQVASGLTKAHAAGIVHRDLKPDNIMVTGDGYAKIVDFGLAKLLEPLHGEFSQFSTDLRSKEGAVLGTVGYMSPEQIEVKPTDHRSDIFSFGCVLYETLTRQRAFEAPSRVDTLHKILHDEPPPMRGISPRLTRIVRRCLAKNPENRYQSMREVAADLRRAVGGAENPFRWRKAQLAVAATGAVIIVGAVFITRSEKEGPAAAPPRIQSLAILPLANLSGDQTQEYFVDGIHEELITDLAQIRALRVISRTSVMQYKKNLKPLPEIARELNVDAVVEGSVVRSGDQVRVTAQLLDARADRHLWAKNYERSIRDVLSLQSDIANAIASEIRVALAPAERLKLKDMRPVNPAAYEAFLKGKEIVSRQRSARNDLQSGMQQLIQAVSLDPTYAPAWAYLAHAYNQMTLYGDLSPNEAAIHAKEAIRRALELDPNQADAHMALATLLFRFDLDWNAAETEYRRAIELNPGDREAHRTYSWYLAGAGRYDEALQEGQRVYELDPIHADVLFGWLYTRAGRYDDAIRSYEKGLQFDPTLYWARANVASSYTFKGQPLRGAAECDKIPAASRDIPTSAVCAWVFAKAGRSSDARAIISDLESANRVYDPWFVAVAYAGIGDKEQVLALLEKAYELRSPNIWGIACDPPRRYLELVRDEPRYQAVLRRVNSPALRTR